MRTLMKSNDFSNMSLNIEPFYLWLNFIDFNREKMKFVNNLFDNFLSHKCL
jgi:hypothetical protein